MAPLFKKITHWGKKKSCTFFCILVDIPDEQGRVLQEGRKSLVQNFSTVWGNTMTHRRRGNQGDAQPNYLEKSNR